MGLLTPVSDAPTVAPMSELAPYVDVWWHSVGDLLELLESLDDADWDTPTDLPGWDVRAVAAHTAHLERVLATGEEEHAEVPEAPHITGLMGMYTEIGVINRRTTPPAQIIEEIRTHTAARHEQLLADPPTDPDAVPERVFGGVPWTWRTLLRNRPLDVFLHEQDIRRAVGRPGNLDSPGAVHTADYLAESFGFVLAKKVGAPTGTTAVLEIEGHAPYAFGVGDDGRGRRLDVVPEQPTVRVSTDRESFLVLAGGRREAEPTRVVLTGDTALGEQLVASMATTP
ncbi:maleylpyruvate isomerase family mycothiol-dependent enzyme [Nocardioides fonticola]|uniref:Maleylpyruvate isomerase family mycothiol-dependent enzyme n=2 Tax=Nocardioides fonticola TaxID=450363 RepID=A0ABP7XM49_9ACTN